MQNRFMVHFTGYSMYPFLKPGDRLIIKPLEEELVEVGDIVVRRDHEHLVAHRLVRLLPDSRGILKGDSLLRPDTDIIALSDLKGRVEALLRGNRLISLSKGKRSRLKKVYAGLSLHNLTYGSLKLRLKQKFIKSSSHNQSNRSNHEWLFVVSLLCDDTHHVSEELNWGIIEKLAYREGVAGVLYYNIKTKHVQSPNLSRLQKIYESIATRNLIYLQRLEEIENALGDQKIHALALKGASLLNNVYQGIGMRSMGDLDLMVHPEGKRIFEKVLIRIGYREDPSIPHLFKREGVTIDLHIHALNIDRISNRTSLLPAGMEPIWKNSIPLDQGFSLLRRPDNVDNVLILSQHLMKHSFSSLIWINDICELLKSFDSEGWIRLAERVEQFGQQRCLTYALYLIRRLFGYLAPKELRYIERSSNLTIIEKVILDARIEGRFIGQVGPLFSFFCISGLTNRTKYIWEALFPSKEVINQEFGSFRGSRRLLFYPYRIIQALTVMSKRFSEMLSNIIRGQ